MLVASPESSLWNCRWRNEDNTGLSGQVQLSELQMCLFARDVEGRFFVHVAFLIFS